MFDLAKEYPHLFSAFIFISFFLFCSKIEGRLSDKYFEQNFLYNLFSSLFFLAIESVLKSHFSFQGLQQFIHFNAAAFHPQLNSETFCDEF